MAIGAILITAGCGSALLAASEPFESAARETMEKLYHIYFENLL